YSNINLKYLIANLNSSISKFWIKNNAATLGDGIYGAKIYIEKLPIPKINSKNQKLVDELINLVDEILKAKEQNKNASTQELENKINSLTYKLYNLTEDEIKIIENKEQKWKI
ncbi:class I SAM-dependent DNA methyltransferase, partial [Campylobacter jejuni]|nr:class I SAM-dependent DNA methyltransferase [Campylobacter jejuni]